MSIKISERDIHKACVKWFYYQYGNLEAILHHSPNENVGAGSYGDANALKRKLIVYNKQMKEMGRLAGYPDITIFYNGRVLLVELKSETGVLSTNQKELFSDFDKTGFKVHVVRSLEEFMCIVKAFMNEKNSA